MFAFTLFGHLQFVVITVLAMLVYSGGHALDIDHQGYQFIGNFFSDLGMTVSHSSKPNLFSSVLFNISLIVLAISELSFYKATAIPVVKRIGVLSAFGLIVVGLTPVNLFPNMHFYAVGLWLVPFFIVMCLISWSSFKKEFQSINPYFDLGLCIVSGLHIMMFFVPAPLQLVVLIQKIVVYYIVAWFSLYSYRRIRTN